MVDHEGTSVQVDDPNLPDGVSTNGHDDGPLGGLGARLSASFDLAIGKLGDTLADQLDEQEQRRRMREQARALPTMVKLSSAFTYQTTGPVICQQGGSGQGVLIGGPEIGDQWSVRQIVVLGPTLTSTVTGQAWVLVSAGTPSELSPTSVVDQAVSLPLVAFYSAEQLYVQPNENVFLVITGGTAGAQYVASFSYQVSRYQPRLTVESV